MCRVCLLFWRVVGLPVVSIHDGLFPHLIPRFRSDKECPRYFLLDDDGNGSGSGTGNDNGNCWLMVNRTDIACANLSLGHSDDKQFSFDLIRQLFAFGILLGET